MKCDIIGDFWIDSRRLIERAPLIYRSATRPQSAKMTRASKMIYGDTTNAANRIPKMERNAEATCAKLDES